MTAVPNEVSLGLTRSMIMSACMEGNLAYQQN
jgi:hypothetical protein